MVRAGSDAGRSLIILLLLPLLLVVTACGGHPEADRSQDRATTSQRQTVDEASDEEAEATVAVDDSGFTLTVGHLTAHGPAGVAPVGTRVTLTQIPLPDDAAQAGLTAAGGAFDISFSDGSQPAAPVTIEVEFEATAGPDEPLVFITQNSQTGAWTGLPVTVDGTTAAVQLDHFSIGIFGWFGGLADQFADEVLRFAQMRHDPPDCHGASPEIGGREFIAETDNDAVYVCVQEQDGRALLTVHSNSPYVWEVRPDTATAHGQWAGAAPLVAAQILTVAVFNLLQGYDYDAATVLVPRGTAPVLLHEGATSTTAVARVDAGLGLIAIAAAGIGMLSAVGVQVPYESLVSVGECAAAVLTTGAEPDLTTVLSTVLGCLGSALTGVAAVLVAGLVSLVPLLATQLTGLLGEFTGANTARITVSSEPVGPSLFEVPEYCDQPVRSVPIGYSELDGKSNSLEGPLAWSPSGLQVVAMFCSAGGVSWPGVLVFYEGGKRVGEVFLNDLEPRVYRGQFDLAEASLDGERLVVPYRWQDSGAAPHRSGEVTLSWDGSPVIDRITGADRGPIDWLNGQYLHPWSEEPENFVDGCSRGPNFTDCTLRIEAAAPAPNDPGRAAVMIYGFDSTGWPVTSHLGLFTSTDGIRTSISSSDSMVAASIGCDVELIWIEDRRLAVDATNCDDAGRLGVYADMGTELWLTD